MLSLEAFAVSEVSCGAHHSLAIGAALSPEQEAEASQTGCGALELLSAGWNLSGQLGLEPPSQEGVRFICLPIHVLLCLPGCVGVRMHDCATPHRIEACKHGCRVFRRVALPAWAGALLACSGGHAHSVAVTRSGLFFEFGGGDFWWLHDSNDFALPGGAEGGDEGWGDPPRGGAWGGQRQAWVPKPIKVGDKERVARASAGHDFTTVLTRSGAVYCLAAGAAGGEAVRVRGLLAAAP